MFWMLKSFASLFFATIILHSSTSAVSFPSLNLPALTGKSSLIAVGKVVSVRYDGAETVSVQGQSFSAKRKLAELQVSRLIKGQSTNSTIYFEFVTTIIYLGFGDIFVNQTGMFFLIPKSPHGLTFTVTDNYHPVVVAVMTAPKAAGSDYERVIAEVVNVLALPQTTLDEKMEAISVLDPIITPDTTTSLRSAANNLNMNVKLRAVSALLKRNDITKIEIAEKALLQTSKEADLNLIRGLASSLHGIKDIKAIATLTRLLDSSLVEARRSAAYALRQMGISGIIKPLTKALYDKDQEVRYQAVILRSGVK